MNAVHKLEYLSVHASRNLPDYRDAAQGKLALFYRPTDRSQRTLTPDTFEQGDLYPVPPAKALDLYALICRGTAPDAIIASLGLQRRPLWQVETEFELPIRGQVREAAYRSLGRTLSSVVEPHYVVGVGWVQLGRGISPQDHNPRLAEAEKSADRLVDLMEKEWD